MNLQEEVVDADQDLSWLSRLSFLWLEITSKCNLRCSHCYAESGPNLPIAQGMPCKDWQHALDEGFTAGCRSMQFIGGEPTLSPDLPKFIEYARRIGYEFVEVFTNGTLLNTPRGNRLMKIFLDGRVNLAFSAYSANKIDHETVTKTSGSFDKTLSGIQKAIEAGIPVRVGVIATDGDLEDVEKTKALIQGMGVESIGIDYIRGIGRGTSDANEQAPEKELCGQCWKGKLCVKPDGTVTPCVFSSFARLGNVKEGLLPILNGEELHRFRKDNREIESTRNSERNGVSDCLPICAPPCPPECYPSCSPCTPDCGPGQCGPQAP